MNSRFAALFLGLALVVTGLLPCLHAESLTDYLPTDAEWDYKVTNNGIVMVGTATGVFDGVDLDIDAVSGSDYFYQDFTMGTAGLEFRRERAGESDSSYDDRYNSGITVARNELASGQNYSYSGTYTGSWAYYSWSGTYTGSCNGNVSVSTTSVTVPAGTYDTLKLTVTHTWSESGGDSGTTYVHWYLAEGVGLVKYYYRNEEDEGDVETIIFEMTGATLPNYAPDKPTGINPADQATGVSRTPTLELSAFSDPNPGDTPMVSQWQVSSSPDFSSRLWTRTNSGDLPRQQIPEGLLAYGTLYYWHGRYQDSKGAWSEWSDALSFTTLEEDTTPPVITVWPASVTMVTHGQPVDRMDGVSASDDIDGDITAAVTVTGTVDSASPGTYQVKYTVSDQQGNEATPVYRQYVVRDVDAPQLVIKPTVVYVTVDATVDLMEGVSATDNIDGDITADVLVSGTVDTSTHQSATIWYSVADNAGNVSEGKRVYHVVYEDLQDTNGNQVDDRWEEHVFGALKDDVDGDSDGDGYTDRQEYERGTDPTEYILELFSGWNFISLARLPKNASLRALAGTAVLEHGFVWGGTDFVSIDHVDPLAGTWVYRYPAPEQSRDGNEDPPQKIACHDLAFPDCPDSDGDGTDDNSDANPASYTIDLAEGWNGVSLARVPNDDSVAAIFGDSISGPVWIWVEDHYERTKQVSPLLGHWLYAPTAATINIDLAR